MGKNVPCLCKYCGSMGMQVSIDSKSPECPVCHREKMILDISEDTFYDLSPEQEDELRFAIQPREQYNDEAWIKRIEWEENRNKRFNRIATEVNAHPTCPYCGSKNTKSINSFDRLTSTMFWGLGNGKIGKQQHCKNCRKNF